MTSEARPTSAEGWLARRQAAQRREWQADEKAKIGAMLARAESYGRGAFRVAVSLLDSGMSYGDILTAARKTPAEPPSDAVHRAGIIRGDSAFMAREETPQAEEGWLKQVPEQAERDWAAAFPPKKAETAEPKICGLPRLRSAACRLAWHGRRPGWIMTRGRSGTAATTLTRHCEGRAPRRQSGFGREGDTMVTKRTVAQEEAIEGAEDAEFAALVARITDESSWSREEVAGSHQGRADSADARGVRLFAASGRPHVRHRSFRAASRPGPPRKGGWP